MMWKTHMLFGFLCAIFAMPFLTPSNPILFVIIAIFAALLPDVDHPNSKVGRKVKVVAMFFEHRGFFHSIFAVGLFLLPIYLWIGSRIIAWAVIIGYLSHLLIDMVSLEGIMPLHPVLKFRIKGIMRTGSSSETVLFFVLLVISAWKLVSLGY